MTQFDIALAALNKSFEGNFAGMRVKSMLLAALAVTDGASINDRKGVVVTESEWLDLCRRVYRTVRNVRNVGLPGGSN